MKQFTIRRCSTLELDACYRLAGEVYGGMGENAKFLDYGEGRFDLSDAMRDVAGQDVAMGAFDENGALVGLCLGSMSSQRFSDQFFGKGSVSGSVNMALVAESARGNHLQLRLVEAVENELASQGARHFVCAVHSENEWSMHNMLEAGYRVNCDGSDEVTLVKSLVVD